MIRKCENDRSEAQTMTSACMKVPSNTERAVTLGLHLTVGVDETFFTRAQKMLLTMTDPGGLAGVQA